MGEGWRLMVGIPGAWKGTVDGDGTSVFGFERESTGVELGVAGTATRKEGWYEVSQVSFPGAYTERADETGAFIPYPAIRSVRVRSHERRYVPSARTTVCPTTTAE